MFRRNIVKNKNKAIIKEKIKGVISSEMTLVQLHKLASENSIHEIVCAIKELLNQGHIKAQKHCKNTENYYFNSLGLWSDKFEPAVK